MGKKLSPEEYRRKHCVDKKVYENKRIARQMARSESKRLKDKLTEYKCQFCRKFHIGHNDTGLAHRTIAFQRALSRRLFKDGWSEE